LYALDRVKKKREKISSLTSLYFATAPPPPAAFPVPKEVEKIQRQREKKKKKKGVWVVAHRNKGTV